jgi:hypothetical protein
MSMTALAARLPTRMPTCVQLLSSPKGHPMDALELFPSDLNLGDHRPGGDGCTRPIGRRGGGSRRRAEPRKPSTLPGRLLELRGLVEAQHAAVMDELAALRRQRRDDGEIPASLLRRVTEIERHLRLVETPTTPRTNRRRPLDG